MSYPNYAYTFLVSFALLFFALGRATVYISGHEHVFQHHFTKGLHHIVAGAAGYTSECYAMHISAINLVFLT